MSDEAPLPNSEEARTGSGEIKDLTPQETPQSEQTRKSDLPAPEPPSKVVSLINEKTQNDPSGVPEKYEFKLPDGYAMNEETGKEVDSLFREIGLDQPSAQKLMDFYIAKSNEAAEAPFNLWTETQKQWVDEIKADPVIGKRLPEVKATVSRAIDGLGDPKLAADFRQAMDITGAGNNPAFVRAFYRLAQQVTEGHHVSGKGPSEAGQQAPDAKPRTAATTLYPNLPS